jgi:hypothetical protein
MLYEILRYRIRCSSEKPNHLNTLGLVKTISLTKINFVPFLDLVSVFFSDMVR